MALTASRCSLSFLNRILKQKAPHNSKPSQQFMRLKLTANMIPNLLMNGPHVTIEIPLVGKSRSTLAADIVSDFFVYTLYMVLEM